MTRAYAGKEKKNLQKGERSLGDQPLMLFQSQIGLLAVCFRDLLGFSAPFSVGAKAVGGIKGATKLVTALKAMGVGAAAEQVAFSKYEPRLSNLIQSLPKAKKIAVIGPLTEYLQADPEDTSADARLKMALEGSIIGGALETVLWGARAIKASKGKPKTQEVPTEAIEPEKLLEDVADTERGAYSDLLRARAAAYQGAAKPVSLKTPTKKAPKKKDYFGNRFKVDPNTGVINAVFKSKKKGDQDFTIVPQEDGTYAVYTKATAQQ